MDLQHVPKRVAPRRLWLPLRNSLQFPKGIPMDSHGEFLQGSLAKTPAQGMPSGISQNSLGNSKGNY